MFDRTWWLTTLRKAFRAGAVTLLGTLLADLGHNNTFDLADWVHWAAPAAAAALTVVDNALKAASEPMSGPPPTGG